MIDFLNNAVITSRSINQQQKDLDQALLSAAGFGNTGRGHPPARWAVSGARRHLVPTAQLLDTYSPELFCLIRNNYDVEPPPAHPSDYNGYSTTGDRSDVRAGPDANPYRRRLSCQPGSGLAGVVGGAPNPDIWPENLPRVNARAAGGAPGCWQPITRHLWPAPELVMDIGNYNAPYNHIDTGSPYAMEFVWGRQVGDNTINP